MSTPPAARSAPSLASRSTVISRACVARARLVGQFSAGELALIADSSNGTRWDAYSVPLLYANVEDGLDDGLAEKWEVEGAALVAKLRALSYIEAAAIVDAVERWWAHEPRPPFAEILKIAP